jgi:drug/metabolite transporter (DMT)-like permease
LLVNILATATYTAFAKTLTGAFSPHVLLLLSEGLTAAFIFFSFGAIPSAKKLLELPKNRILPLVAVGIFSGFLGPLLWFSGVQQTTAVNATLFGNTEMVFMIILAVFLLHEKFTRIHLASIVTIAIGGMVVALQGFSTEMNIRGGDLLIILSCLSFSIGSIAFRKYLHHMDPHLTILVRSLIGILGFFLLSPFVHVPLVEQLSAFPLQTIPVLVGFALVSRFLNVFAFYMSLDRLPVTRISLAANITTVLAILFSAWFLSEQLYVYHAIGGALIVVGALLLDVVGIHRNGMHLKLHLHYRQPHRA